MLARPLASAAVLLLSHIMNRFLVPTSSRHCLSHSRHLMKSAATWHGDASVALRMPSLPIDPGMMAGVSLSQFSQQFSP
jgi:hypothetical protein